MAAVHLPTFPFTVLDTETTGFTPRVNHVIEFASIRMKDGKEVQRHEGLYSIPTEVPEMIQVLTRIRPKGLEGKPTFEAERQGILDAIGEDTLIVGQNITFDLRMLRGEGVDLFERPSLDTSMLASLVFPELRSYSLGYVSRVLELNHTPKHRAMGDVVATLELFARCFERMCALPQKELDTLRDVLSKATSGYKLLADHLPEKGADATPSWLSAHAGGGQETKSPPYVLPAPASASVQLADDTLEPQALHGLLQGASKTKVRTWVAVKNLPAQMERMGALPEGVCALVPAFALANPEAVQALLQQESFTADEATLAVKLHWYGSLPMWDLPIHGEERAVWSGKLACLDTTPAYVAQRETLTNTVLLDHRQLLQLVDPAGNSAGVIAAADHVIVDDASMLEETTSKAFGWELELDSLRAGAVELPAVISALDLVQIWLERIRNGQDVRYIGPGDVSTPEAEAVAERVKTLAEDTSLPALLQRHLTVLLRFFDAAALSSRITFFEQRQNGAQTLTSVPDHTARLLNDVLYARHHVSLVVPPRSAGALPEIVAAPTVASEPVQPFPPLKTRIDYPEEISLEGVLRDPPQGKTIVLVGSKRTIEDAFIRWTETLEKAGTTLLCQGMGGGLERMQAEFAAAPGPAVWMLTPWMYEGANLPLGTVDQLVLQTIPFDHPSHTVCSRRAEHYRDPFGEYALLRTKYRLFRLLKAFARHAKPMAEFLLIDDRLRTKKYGKDLLTYLAQFAQPVERVEGKDQLQLF